MIGDLGHSEFLGTLGVWYDLHWFKGKSTGNQRFYLFFTMKYGGGSGQKIPIVQFCDLSTVILLWGRYKNNVGSYCTVGLDHNPKFLEIPSFLERKMTCQTIPNTEHLGRIPLDSWTHCSNLPRIFMTASM